MAALKCKVGWPTEYAGHCTMVMSQQENASSSNNSNKIMDRVKFTVTNLLINAQAMSSNSPFDTRKHSCNMALVVIHQLRPAASIQQQMSCQLFSATDSK